MCASGRSCLPCTFCMEGSELRRGAAHLLHPRELKRAASCVRQPAQRHVQPEPQLLPRALAQGVGCAAAVDKREDRGSQLLVAAARLDQGNCFVCGRRGADLPQEIPGGNLDQWLHAARTRAAC